MKDLSVGDFPYLEQYMLSIDWNQVTDLARVPFDRTRIENLLMPLFNAETAEELEQGALGKFIVNACHDDLYCEASGPLLFGLLEGLRSPQQIELDTLNTIIIEPLSELIGTIMFYGETSPEFEAEFLSFRRGDEPVKYRQMAIADVEKICSYTSILSDLLHYPEIDAIAFNSLLSILYELMPAEKYVQIFANNWDNCYQESLMIWKP